MKINLVAPPTILIVVPAFSPNLGFVKSEHLPNLIDKTK